MASHTKTLIYQANNTFRTLPTNRDPSIGKFVCFSTMSINCKVDILGLKKHLMCLCIMEVRL